MAQGVWATESNNLASEARSRVAGQQVTHCLVTIV